MEPSYRRQIGDHESAISWRHARANWSDAPWSELGHSFALSFPPKAIMASVICWFSTNPMTPQ